MPQTFANVSKRYKTFADLNCPDQQRLQHLKVVAIVFDLATRWQCKDTNFGGKDHRLWPVIGDSAYHMITNWTTF